MKTSVLRQNPRDEDDAFLFAVPALLLATVLAVGGLMLLLAEMSTEPAPKAAAPAAESSATSLVGA